MCTNCLSTAESVAAQAGLAAYLLKRPVHRALATCGVLAEPDPVAHDVRTVAFLRSLDLDPVEVLGADVVDAAARWVPAPRRTRQPLLARWAASAAPMRSQTAISTP